MTRTSQSQSAPATLPRLDLLDLPCFDLPRFDLRQQHSAATPQGAANAPAKMSTYWIPWGQRGSRAAFVGQCKILFAAILASGLIGCASNPPLQADPNFAPISASDYPQPAAPTSGAIYRAGSGGMALFADHRARQPGDLLTITLSERTLAQSRSTTSTSKETDIGLSGSLAGAPLTMGGRDLLANTIAAENGFAGTGNSDQSNRLEGSLTVTVINRMPNGNLLVRGEKLLRLNRADEVVQVQGIIRPADILQDNSVPSGRVGDARIVYTGRGALGQANAMGWLSRFFNSAVMP